MHSDEGNQALQCSDPGLRLFILWIASIAIAWVHIGSILPLNTRADLKNMFSLIAIFTS